MPPKDHGAVAIGVAPDRCPARSRSRASSGRRAPRPRASRLSPGSGRRRCGRSRARARPPVAPVLEGDLVVLPAWTALAPDRGAPARGGERPHDLSVAATAAAPADAAARTGLAAVVHVSRSARCKAPAPTPSAASRAGPRSQGVDGGAAASARHSGSASARLTSGRTGGLGHSVSTTRAASPPRRGGRPLHVAITPARSIRYADGMRSTPKSRGHWPLASAARSKRAGWRARNARAASGSSSRFTASTASPRAPKSRARLFKNGNDSVQLSHQDAQKSSHSTRPRYCSRATGCAPPISVRAQAGAARPLLAGAAREQRQPWHTPPRCPASFRGWYTGGAVQRGRRCRSGSRPAGARACLDRGRWRPSMRAAFDLASRLDHARICATRPLERRHTRCVLVLASRLAGAQHVVGVPASSVV